MSDPNNRAGKDHKPLKDLAKENPTLIGDPISMKAETSNTEPTDADRPNKSDTARNTKNVNDEKKSTFAPTEDDSKAWESENKGGKSKL